MFNDSLNIVLESEGGYSNNKSDKGGETYRGISRLYNPDWKGWQIIEQAKPLKNNQIIKSNILDNLIADYYKKNYWDTINGDYLPKQVAPLLFDFAVNSGVGSASKAFQKIVSQLSGKKIVIDGKIGQGTINAANLIDSKKLFNTLMDYRIAYYENIATKNPTQKKFLTGWLNRLKKYQFEIQLGAGIFIAIIGFWLLFRK
jgi:lysozyme family protein